MSNLVLRSGVNPVVNGPGWVSGDIANLGVGGSMSAIFDLGPDWYEYTYLAATYHVGVGNTSTGTNMQVYFSTDGISYWRGPSRYTNGTAYGGPYSAVSGNQSVLTITGGRYVKVSFGGVATAAFPSDACCILIAHQ